MLLEINGSNFMVVCLSNGKEERHSKSTKYSSSLVVVLVLLYCLLALCTQVSAQHSQQEGKK